MTSRWVIRALAVLALVSLGVLYGPDLKPEAIAGFVKRNSTAAPLVFVAVCAARPLLFFLPSMGLTVVAGVLFGALWGTVYVAIGGVFSTVVGFYFARWLGRDAMEKLVLMSRRLKDANEWTRKDGMRSVLMMRIFNLPWDIVSYWAGVSGVRFSEFFTASLIALLPISFLYTYFGSTMFSPGNPGFAVSLFLIVGLGALPHVMKRLGKKEKCPGA